MKKKEERENGSNYSLASEELKKNYDVGFFAVKDYFENSKKGKRHGNNKKTEDR